MAAAAPMREIKILVYGDGQVGKRSLAECLIYFQGIEGPYDPTIEDSFRKQMEVEGDLFMVDLWLYRVRRESSAYEDQLFRAHIGGAFVFVYDITRRETLDCLRAAQERILHVQDRDPDEGWRLPCILIGTHADKAETARAVTREEAAAALIPASHGRALLHFEVNVRDRRREEAQAALECFGALISEWKAWAREVDAAAAGANGVRRVKCCLQ